MSDYMSEKREAESRAIIKELNPWPRFWTPYEALSSLPLPALRGILNTVPKGVVAGETVRLTQYSPRYIEYLEERVGLTSETEMFAFLDSETLTPEVAAVDWIDLSQPDVLLLNGRAQTTHYIGRAPSDLLVGEERELAEWPAEALKFRKRWDWCAANAVGGWLVVAGCQCDLSDDADTYLVFLSDRDDAAFRKAFPDETG